MVNPDFWRTLYFDEADFKPRNKYGELVVATPKRKGKSLPRRSQLSVKKPRMGDLRSLQSSATTPTFEPSKHIPAPLGESAWPRPGYGTLGYQVPYSTESLQRSSSQTKSHVASPSSSTVPNPKEAQRLVDQIIDGFDDIPEKQLTLFRRLVRPQEKYIQNQDLAEHLAKKKEECVRQEAVTNYEVD